MMARMKKGVIVSVQDQGSMWSMTVKDNKGNATQISGDWRPMRDGLDDAFDISQNEFPYVSGEKIKENVIGQEIEFVPDEIFGASSWKPLYSKKKLRELI